jgi:hypothetical protein
MITVAAGSKIAALKIENLTVLEAGTTSGELVDRVIPVLPMVSQEKGRHLRQRSRPAAGG